MNRVEESSPVTVYMQPYRQHTKRAVKLLLIFASLPMVSCTMSFEALKADPGPQTLRPYDRDGARLSCDAYYSALVAQDTADLKRRRRTVSTVVTVTGATLGLLAGILKASSGNEKINLSDATADGTVIGGSLIAAITPLIGYFSSEFEDGHEQALMNQGLVETYLEKRDSELQTHVPTSFASLPQPLAVPDDIAGARSRLRERIEKTHPKYAVDVGEPCVERLSRVPEGAK